MSALLAAATKKQLVDAAIRLVVGDVEDPEAFAALVAAARAHLAAQGELADTPAALVPFGPHRGKPLSVLSTRELISLEGYLSAALQDSAKLRFRRQNLELRSAVLAELHRRR